MHRYGIQDEYRIEERLHGELEVLRDNQREEDMAHQFVCGGTHAGFRRGSQSRDDTRHDGNYRDEREQRAKSSIPLTQLRLQLSSNTLKWARPPSSCYRVPPTVKRESGYRRQGAVENFFFRYKRTLGNSLRARLRIAKAGGKDRMQRIEPDG